MENLSRRGFVSSLLISPFATKATIGEENKVTKTVTRFIAIYEIDTFERGHAHRDRTFLFSEATEEEAIKSATLYERFVILDDFYCWAELKNLLGINTVSLGTMTVDFDRDRAIKL